MKKTLSLLAMLAFVAACGGGSESPGAADGAIESLQRKLDELTENSDVPVQWAAEDIENIGDWDYRVMEIPDPTAEELEAILNGLGDDRWQAFWIERTRDGYTIFLRKPSISYLSKIPLSQLGKLIIPGSSE